MKKRIFGLVMVVCMLAAFVPCVQAEDIVNSGWCGDYLTWTIDDKGTLTISGNGSMPSYPEFHSNSDGESIDKKTVKRVVIDNGVSNIGNYAFYECPSLEHVILSDSIETIGASAFYKCGGLRSIDIPGSTKTIGESAFAECENLENVILRDGVTNIFSTAFSECNSLRNINIPSSVNSIGASAFDRCPKLETVTLHEGLEYISRYCFYGCSSLKNITLPNSLKSVGESAFHECVGLKSINITTGYYYPDVFYGCDSLTSATIASGVTSISSGLFNECSSLTSIAIPLSVISIGEYAFSGCPLTDIYYSGTKNQWNQININQNGNEDLVDDEIPVHCIFDTSSEATSGSCGENLQWVLTKDGTLKISGTGDMYDYYFYEADEKAPWDLNREFVKKVILANGVTSIGRNSFYKCYNLISVDIPNTVTRTGWGIFYDCKKLKNIFIPASVESMGIRPFGNCGSLDISVDTQNMSYSSIDGVLFNKDKTALIEYCKDTIHTDYIVPDGVTAIDRYAFYGCTNLKSIVFPDSLISIDEYAFGECKNITRISFPDSVTLIGKSAFRSCSKLLNIHLPENLTNINEYSFYGCNKLTNVTIPYGVTYIGTYAFAFCGNIKYAYIPDSITAMSGTPFLRCDTLSDVYYGGSEENWNSSGFSEQISSRQNVAIHYNSAGVPTPEILDETTIRVYGDTYTFNVKLKDVPYNCELMTILYDNGVMTCLQSTPITSSDTEKTIPLTADNATTANIFIWDNLKGMKPLCDVVTIEEKDFVSE